MKKRILLAFMLASGFSVSNAQKIAIIDQGINTNL